MSAKKQVLILCTGNSARSQMAEGLLRHYAGDRFHVESAGTKPSRVRPEAIAVMGELGIDISRHRSKHVDDFAGQSFDFVITVCDKAKESCPLFLHAAKHLHHSFEDPPPPTHGTDDERLAIFRRVRDELKDYLTEFAKANKTDYQIRPANTEDWPAITALLTASGLPLAGAEQHLSNFLVATEEDKIIGVAGLEIYGTAALMRSLAVSPPHRNQQIADQLVQQLLRRARAQGLSSVSLLTTTAPSYFQRFGFQSKTWSELPGELSSSEELRGACPSSAMALHLVFN